MNPTSRAGRVVHLLAFAAPGLAGRGVQFLVLAWLATEVVPSEYGRFAALQLVVTGAASIVGSTVGVTANVAAAAGRRHDVPAVAVAVAVIRLRARLLLLNAAASTAVVVVGAVLLTHPSSVADLAPALIAGLLSGAVPFAEILVGVLAGRGRPGASAALDAARGIGGAAGAGLLGVLAGGLAAASGLLVVDVLIASVLLARTVRPASPVVALHVSANEGAVAGIAANVLGQVATWLVLGAVSVTGGPVALGVYGVAMRFASVITVAPVYLGKVVVGQFVDAPDRRRAGWTPQSFTAVVATLCAAGSVASLLVLVIAFPGLVDDYPGVVPVTVAVLGATSVRALLICVGQVCVARRAWRTWVLADLTALGVTAIAVPVVLVLQGSLVAVVLVSGLGHGAGLVARLVGLRRARTRGPAVAR